MAFVFTLDFCGTTSAYAHIPIVLEKDQGLYDEQFQIRDAITSMAYYDVIYDSPKFYTLTVTKSGEFYINLSVPKISDTPQCRPTVSMSNAQNIDIYKSIGTNTAWSNFHEPFGNADYFLGAEAKIHVIPGEYRIQVSSDTNNCKYVLATGTVEKFEFSDFVSSVYLIPIINQNFFEMNPVQSIINMSGMVMLILGLSASIVFFIVRRIKI